MKRKRYKYGWFICCALYSAFLTIIGYPIVTWEWWLGEIIFCVGEWCSLNMN